MGLLGRRWGRATEAKQVTVESMHYPFVSKVVGISNYQQVAVKCSEGMVVEVRHEPDNPYDQNACRVVVGGETLGYLPKLLAARLMRDGSKNWVGEVAAKHQGDVNIGVEVRILREEGDEDTLGAERGMSAATAGAGERRVVVVKRSGRILGRLVRVERDARRVIVENESGTIPYPDGLVDIVEHPVKA